MAILLEDGATPLVQGNHARPEPATRRPCSGSIVAGVAALAMVIVLFAASNNNPTGTVPQALVGLEAFDAACGSTFYPETCRQTLLANQRAHAADPEGLTRIVVTSASKGVTKTLAAVLASRGVDSIGFSGERVCHQTLVSSIEQLEASLDALNSLAGSDLSQYPFDELKTGLSAAMEFHTTCVDALMETGALEPHTLAAKQHTEELLSNALAFVNALSRFGTNLQSWEPTRLHADDAPSDDTTPAISLITSRRFLTPSGAEGFPVWMSGDQQEHLVGAPTSDVVVAKDGSGKFRSIQAAIDAAPKTGSASAKRYVIYIKSGVYNEQVTVPKKATNFMFIGDGAGKSVITGDRSVAKTPGMTTFLSASLIVEGPGFIGRAFTAQNTAGAEGHQAVAMRVSADMAAFYQCSFDSWQDTLYTHTFRQYYRECTILGTIDFIFGNGVVAFQSCAIIAKKSPIRGQQNTYTAQGRTDQGQATGLSFQSCTFDATEELKANTATFKTFLGRPWKPYSTHVNLKCNLLGHIDPAGWLPWNTSDFGLKTSFFAEWQDFGAGANTGKRVWWSKQITDTKVAQKYQAVTFNQANQWVPATGIPLTTSLP